jgi:adenine phosphoribosyltransferase
VQLNSASLRLKNAIRDIPDFPQPGITFRDITPVIEEGNLFRLAMTMLADRYQRRNIEVVVGIDARGFIFGSALAYLLGTGMVMVRKKGKLPFKTTSVSYDLEYGSNTVEMHVDSIKPKQRVLVIDDVLATGGTMAAACDLIRQSGGEIIEAAFLVELSFLKGAEKIKPTPCYSLIQY